MEHMTMPWVAVTSGHHGDWRVLTNEICPWVICSILHSLPADMYGHKTAQAICDEHNAALEGE